MDRCWHRWVPAAARAGARSDTSGCQLREPADASSGYHSWRRSYFQSFLRVRRRIPVVCNAIYSVLQTYISVPTSTDDWLSIEATFKKWNFPHVLGAVDGKHIAIKKPAKSGSVYFNYKKFFSLILLVAADGDGRIISYDLGRPGCLLYTSDAADE